MDLCSLAADITLSCMDELIGYTVIDSHDQTWCPQTMLCHDMIVVFRTFQDTIMAFLSHF